MIRTAITALMLTAGIAAAQPAGAMFVSAGLTSRTANFLDSSLNVISTFDTGGSFDGIAVGGGNIFVADFSAGGWHTYDLDGNFISTIATSDGFTFEQGLTYINGMLMTGGGPDLKLYQTDGTFVSTVVVGAGSTVEGVTFDGNNTVYALADTIDVYDFTTGALLNSFANPAINESFGGTALTYLNGDLIVGGQSGNWWRVDASNGAIQDSGTGNTDLFGLAVVAIPAPASSLALAGFGFMASRRRR